MAQRKEQSTKVANAMAKEAGIPVNLFKEKSRDFRNRHHQKVGTELMLLSEEEYQSDTLSEAEQQFINQRVLGYKEKQQYDVMDEAKMAELQK